jgi:hypothetical protein
VQWNDLWLAKIPICIQIMKIDGSFPLPAFVQNWSYVPAAETTVDLAYSFLPLSQRSSLGEPGASATACCLEAKASTDAIRRFRSIVLVDTPSGLAWMEAGSVSCSAGDCCAMASSLIQILLDLALSASSLPRQEVRQYRIA